MLWRAQLLCQHVEKKYIIGRSESEKFMGAETIILIGPLKIIRPADGKFTHRITFITAALDFLGHHMHHFFLFFFLRKVVMNLIVSRLLSRNCCSYSDFHVSEFRTTNVYFQVEIRMSTCVQRC